MGLFIKDWEIKKKKGRKEEKKERII